MKRFLIHVSTYWCGMDDYDYFSRYSTIYYMDYMYPQNFGNHEYASWSEMSYEEGNRVIGCIYDW